ncbi:hypothetical protein VK70_10240 [Paenibacillus durus ATCC 35681]|uniref:Uncharacterized protein n=1 Tax=Paenibacillus durus ATCC 35681 TaxID=1333534 RepID=A0A0F7CHZ0_PAEDU|nr:hypothetical protein VK70_10240 [Paenibacillus durus ATCC 35681]
MKDFEIISMDMFQTLVNIDTRIKQIWRPILQNTFTAHLAEEYGQTLLKYFFTHWNELRTTGQFHLMNEVYERSFTQLFKEKAVSYDVGEAVRIIFQEHTLSQLYDETAGFLESVSKSHKVCNCSNSIEPTLNKCFISGILLRMSSELIEKAS